MTQIKRLKYSSNGQWLDSKTTKYMAVMNPSTGEQIAEAPSNKEPSSRHAVQRIPRRYLEFLHSPAARKILENFGYRLPQSTAVFPNHANPQSSPVKMLSCRSFSSCASMTVALLVASASSPALRADAAAEIKALRAELQAMEQKLAALEQKEAQREHAAPVPASASAASTVDGVKVDVSDLGLVAATPDRSSFFHVGGVAQLDSRLFLHDGGGVLNNSFILRRARVTTDGTLGRLASFQFVPEFGNGSNGTANAVTILDANATISFTPAVQLKFGKFKSPVGLEELQTDPKTQFVERSLVNNLMPNRDVGAVVGGTLFGGTVNYTLGLVNGIADNTTNSGNSDFDNDKDAVARVFFQPFTRDRESLWQGLGFGVGASEGREKGTSGVTAGYKSDGQQTFFKYGTNVVADGRVWRVSPQAYYYRGPFSALAEYAVSTVNVRPSAPTATVTPPKVALQHKAREFSMGWVLTGEPATYAGVVPRQAFNWANGNWGAVQVVARYSDLKIDPNSFPLFASSLSNAQQAKAVGIGLNWYLTKALRLTQDYFQTGFTTPTGTSISQILRQDENAFITRFQIAF